MVIRLQAIALGYFYGYQFVTLCLLQVHSYFSFGYQKKLSLACLTILPPSPSSKETATIVTEKDAR